LPNGIVLLNDGIAGHWRRTTQKDSVRVEVLLYENLESAAVRALEAEARNLGRFLRRDVTAEAALV
jgi:hypothetical protein